MCDCLMMMYSQEQQLQTTHGTNLDDMETSTFVTDQFLTNVRHLIGYAIDAVHSGESSVVDRAILYLAVFQNSLQQPCRSISSTICLLTLRSISASRSSSPWKKRHRYGDRYVIFFVARLNIRIHIGLFAGDLFSAREKCSSSHVQR